MNPIIGLDIVTLDRLRVQRHMRDILTVASDIPGEYWSEQHFLDERPGKFQLSQLALQDTRAVGYAVISERAPGCAHLHHLIIVRQHRGYGLGGALLHRATAVAKQAGHTRMSLKVATANTGARDFYRRHGFVEGEIAGTLIWCETKFCD